MGESVFLKKARQCDFCGRSEKEAEYLIVSPDERHDICNACVDVCVEIIATKREAKRSPTQSEPEK